LKQDELNILEVIDMLMRRWWIILITMLLSGVLTFVFTEVFIEPSYSSEGTLYVNANREQVSSMTTGTITASKQLVATYAEILQRRTFLEGVASDVENKYSISELQGMLDITGLNETEIMQIKVTCNDPEDAYMITHSILMRAPDELMRVVEAGSVKLLDDAVKNNVAVSPNIKKNTFIGLLAGIVLGALIIIMMELIDTRIKSAEAIISQYEEPLLGEIPAIMEMKM